jgi:VWFA-related protein
MRVKVTSSPHVPMSFLMEGIVGRQSRHAFLFFLVCAGLMFGATDKLPTSTYHTGVAEVQLTFFATDQNRRAVAVVLPADFAIVDQDLVVRNFNSFGRTAWTDLDVAVVVDSSESVAAQFKKEIASTLQLMTQGDGIPEENFSLISFHRLEPTLICAGNCRRTHAADLVPTAAVGATPLFDSIVFATDLISRRAGPHSRKVLILFSDGEDTISRNAASDAIEAAVAQDIQIYGVDLNPSGRTSEGTFLLQKMASVTGGRYFVLRQDADKIYDALLEDFHATYAVTYKLLGRAMGFHSVRILPTHNLNLHFHCRSGYEYAGR